MLQEIRLHGLCSADCRAIVRYVFACQTEDALLAIMEACDLHLWDAISNGEAWPPNAAQPTQAERETWTISLCDAVQHCHNIRVMHRDISPWNVLLVRQNSGNADTVDKADTTSGTMVRYSARLADFGLALQLPSGIEELCGVETEGAVDLDESAMGSLYSAPELGKSYNFAADNFSLGMTLFAIWTAAGCANEDNLINSAEAMKKAAMEAGPMPANLLFDLPHNTRRTLIHDLFNSAPEARPKAAEAYSTVRVAPLKIDVPKGDELVQGYKNPVTWRSKCIRCFGTRRMSIKAKEQPGGVYIDY